jgi:hypothetical protein
MPKSTSRFVCDTYPCPLIASNRFDTLLTLTRNSQGLHAIFERFRGVLHEGEIDKRVQYMIEGLFAVRKNNFADFPALESELDLVDADDQITHELSLDDQIDPGQWLISLSLSLSLSA